MEWIYAFFAALIPTIVSGVLLMKMQKKLDQAAVEAEQHNEDRKVYELCLLRMCNASMALGEATAQAVQRIPDAKCNGDMHKALEYAETVKNETKDFMNRKAVEHFV